MDRITSSLLTDFCREHSLTQLAQDKQFEHFATYLAMSRFESDSFSTADLVTGNGGDTSIDAIGIVVNGALVLDVDEIAVLAQQNKYLDVTFVFVQATQSAGFTGSRFGDIAFGVGDFFKEKPTLPRNQAVSDKAEIMSAIFERSTLFSKGNPECRVFYVTTGKWVKDPHLEARRTAAVDSIRDTGLFREVEFSTVGVDDIQRLYHQTKNAISRQFTFTNKNVIPEGKGVKEAYIGLLPALEFLPLITDEEGMIVKSIFYDNVRDWLGDNEVNQGIKDTVADAEKKSRFALMNNGVTIIAKKLKTTAHRFTIEDYQIVNGCQTSHALYEQRAHLDATVMIPVRLIVTEDDDVVASIIKATNKQTEVREEQFFALSDFGRKLEAYFQAFENGKKLFYERRARQYNALSIEKTRVITHDSLIRAYISVFLEEPHRTTRSFGDVKATVGKTIFLNTDRPEPYYVSAFALYRLEYLFRNSTLEAKYKPARYLILMAFRLLADPSPVPRANSNEMGKYCERLTPWLWDSNKAQELFTRAAEVVHEVAGGNFNRDVIRTLAYRDSLRDKCLEIGRKAATAAKTKKPPAT